MKTAILFDLDGTLLDTLGDLADATNYTLRHFGRPERTLEEMRGIIGNGVRNLLIRAFGEEPENLEEVLSVYRAYYDTHSRIKTGPYPGVLDALAQLKETYPVAIVSNKPHGVVKELCAHFFPGIYALGEDPSVPRKPAPDMVQKALRELGADRCVYVGDTEVDVQTAKNAGAPCLCVLWGFRDREDLEGATDYCEDAACLVEKIRRMAGE